MLLVTTVKYDAQSMAWDILLVLTSVAGNLCNKCPSGYSNKTAVKVILSMRSLVSIEQQSPRRPCDIKTLVDYSGFSQSHNIGNNANIDIRGFNTLKQKKSSDKMLSLVRI